MPSFDLLWSKSNTGKGNGRRWFSKQDSHMPLEPVVCKKWLARKRSFGMGLSVRYKTGKGIRYQEHGAQGIRGLFPWSFRRGTVPGTGRKGLDVYSFGCMCFNPQLTINISVFSCIFLACFFLQRRWHGTWPAVSTSPKTSTIPWDSHEIDDVCLSAFCSVGY